MALNSKYLDSESHIQWRHNQLNFSFSIFSLVINLLLCSINPHDLNLKIFHWGGSGLNSYESCHRLYECILATNWVKSLLNFTRLVVAEQELVDTLSISALQLAVGADGLICVKVGSNAPWLGQLITVVDLEYNCKMIQFMAVVVAQLAEWSFEYQRSAVRNQSSGIKLTDIFTVEITVEKTKINKRGQEWSIFF